MAYNDAHVVAGSEDGGVYFWGLVSGKLLHTLKGHTGTVASVDYHPKQHAMLTADTAGAIFFWRAAPG